MYFAYNSTKRIYKGQHKAKIVNESDVKQTKINLHIHNPLPDIIGNKQHIYHIKSITSLPCRNHKSCVHITLHKNKAQYQEDRHEKHTTLKYNEVKTKNASPANLLHHAYNKELSY